MLTCSLSGKYRGEYLGNWLWKPFLSIYNTMSAETYCLCQHSVYPGGSCCADSRSGPIQNLIPKPHLNPRSLKLLKHPVLHHQVQWSQGLQTESVKLNLLNLTSYEPSQAPRVTRYSNKYSTAVWHGASRIAFVVLSLVARSTNQPTSS